MFTVVCEMYSAGFRVLYGFESQPNLVTRYVVKTWCVSTSVYRITLVASEVASLQKDLGYQGVDSFLKEY